MTTTLPDSLGDKQIVTLKNGRPPKRIPLDPGDTPGLRGVTGTDEDQRAAAKTRIANRKRTFQSINDIAASAWDSLVGPAPFAALTGGDWFASRRSRRRSIEDL